jgi:hypothetical protein
LDFVVGEQGGGLMKEKWDYYNLTNEWPEHLLSYLRDIGHALLVTAARNCTLHKSDDAYEIELFGNALELATRYQIPEFIAVKAIRLHWEVR